MTFCPQCGKQVAQGSRFCENCGAALSQGTAGSAVASSPAQPLTQYDLAQDPVLRNYRPIDPPPDLPFRLQDGEVILKAIKPSRKIIARSAIRSIIGAVVFGAFFAIPLILAVTVGPQSGQPVPAFIKYFLYFALAVPFLILAAGVGTSFMGYRQLAYWITNKRTIGRRGVVGYSTDSMPLENIADVVISRGVFDRVTGLSTLYIQPFGGAGMMMAPGDARMNPYTGSNSFTGINHDEAADIQQLIFHLRDAIKREMSR